MNNINLLYQGKLASRHPNTEYHIFDGFLDLPCQEQLTDWCERNLKGYFRWWSPWAESDFNDSFNESFGELWIADDQDAVTVRTFWQGNANT